MSVKLSVVIPTYNSKDLVQQCLVFLENQSAPLSHFEVIVVDDGSQDGTLEALKAFGQKTPLNLKSQYISNAGPATARNVGVQQASAPWVALLDADVMADVNWVARALELIEQYPDVAAFEGKTEINERHKLTPFTHQTENLKGGRYLTCNMVIRKTLCHFYPKYRMPFREDTDLAFCLMASGYTIHFDPNLKVFHPPLSPLWMRPLKLALRYRYDGLLKRRFPKYYKEKLDAHRLLGILVPHVRKKIYGLFLVGQILLLMALTAPPFQGVWLALALAIFCPTYGLTCWLYFRLVMPQSRKVKDLLPLMLVNLGVPWVMYFQLFKGHVSFRKEPPFDSRQWLHALNSLKQQGMEGVF